MEGATAKGGQAEEMPGINRLAGAAAAAAAVVAAAAADR